MAYAAMFAIMAMLGATAGGATAMAAGFGHGAADGPQAQNQWTGPAEFGNGSCDGGQYLLQADADGDGIPNGQDPDWVPPLDGTGYQHGNCTT